MHVIKVVNKRRRAMLLRPPVVVHSTLHSEIVGLSQYIGLESRQPVYILSTLAVMNIRVISIY